MASDTGVLKIEARLESLSAYSSSRYLMEPELQRRPGEQWPPYEDRVWRHKMHLSSDRTLVIPADAFKQAITSAATYRSECIPGKGKATWTKHMRSGVLTFEFDTGIPEDKVNFVQLHCDAQGRPGAQRGRVLKKFPIVQEWSGALTIWLIDPQLKENADKVREYLEHAGAFIGVGRWRPQNGGHNGRFQVVSFEPHE